MGETYITPEGPPSRWIAKGGKPAACAGPDGMPSYESEHTGELKVLDLLVAQAGRDGQLKFLSTWYGTACVVSHGEGPVPLHHSPDAVWSWRPLLYRKDYSGIVHALGSQAELAWRHGLMEMMHHVHAEGELTMDEACDRADALLLEHLDMLQRIEYAAWGKFRVRGGKTGNVYRVRPGDGFELLSKTTMEPVVSYCLHPEHWLPNGDVALSLKLMLEDPELEVQVLEGARGTWQGFGRHGTRFERHAAELERDLIR